jgi:hypothetical protein
MNGIGYTNMRTLGALDADDVQTAAGNLLMQLQQSGASQAALAVVSTFQQLYNSEGGSPAIAVDGQYGPCTQSALQAVLNASPVNQPPQAAPGSAFPGHCANGGYVAPPGSSPSPGAGPTGPSGPIGPAGPSGLATTSGLPAWAKWLIGSLIVASVAFLGWSLMKSPKGGRGGHRRALHRAKRRIRAHARRLRRRR